MIISVNNLLSKVVISLFLASGAVEIKDKGPVGEKFGVTQKVGDPPATVHFLNKLSDIRTDITNSPITTCGWRSK